MFGYSPNLVEILISKVMELGSGAFGWRLGHEDGALTNGISALLKRYTRDFFLLSLFPHHVRIQ